MKITDVKIFKTKSKGALLGYANVVLDNQFIIRGIALLETEKNGRFIGMPSRRLRGEGKHFRDNCHPLNAEVREKLTKAVFDAYEKFLKAEE